MSKHLIQTSLLSISKLVRGEFNDCDKVCFRQAQSVASICWTHRLLGNHLTTNMLMFISFDFKNGWAGTVFFMHEYVKNVSDYLGYMDQVAWNLWMLGRRVEGGHNSNEVYFWWAGKIN